MKERTLDDKNEDINAVDSMNESDYPERLPNPEKLPILKKIEHPEDDDEKEKKKDGKGAAGHKTGREKSADHKKRDGMDKAMEQLDEYYDGTPVRDHRFDHGGE